MSTQSEQQETIITPSKPTTSTSSNTPLDTDVTPLSEAQIKKLLEDAEELKQEGNDHFRAGKWNEAIVAYQSALGRLPKRKQKKGNDRDSMKEVDDVGKEGEGTDAEGSNKEEGVSETEPEEVTPLQAECAKARSVLNANLAACHVKLDEHSEVVATCTEALRDDPDYVKALQRRAASNEILDTWASLASAQEDYTKLLSLLPSGSTQYIEARRKLAAVKPRAEAAQKKETSEMLDKLKGIGNSILGNFGLSTNNFQFTPNGQGGYSMNFVR